MNQDLSKEKLELFDSTIRSLSIAIKNSVIYPFGHPIPENSIKIFKDNLEKWLVDEEKMDLGITQDNLLLNQKFIKETSDLYKEVADYLHQRGIIALSFLKGLDIGELKEFFKFIRNDARVFWEKGGILKNIPATPYLKIKEIDYSSILVSTKPETSFEEKDLWQFFRGIKEISIGEQLLESKREFLMEFLKDHKKSASLLNKIYKETLVKRDEKSVVENIREAFVKITKYFERFSPEDSRQAAKDLTDIIVKLDSNLLVSLFEEVNINGINFDLSKEIIKDFSDDMIADFIGSLISSEDRLHENLLKLFDKLVPEKEKSQNVALMVADKLLKNLDKDTLAKLKISIQEAFKANPENNFMSQMYKLTVETFIGREATPGIFAGKYSRLLEECQELLSEESLKKERIRLLLNIIWSENDPEQIKKFCAILIESFKEILTPKYMENIKETAELLIEKIRPQQRNNERIAQEIENTLGKLIIKENITKIISFIPTTNPWDLDNIAYVCVKAEPYAADVLLDAFVLEKDPLIREKFTYVLTRMDKRISKVISQKLQNLASKDFSIFKDLFKILKTVDSEETRSFTEKMLRHPDAQIRLELLESFIPQTEEQRKAVFEIFAKEKNRDIQKKIIVILAKTQDKETIDKLFNKLERGFLRKRYLLDLVKLCGDFKIQESLPHLERILRQRPFFYTKATDQLRVASVLSLGQIGIPEAGQLIEKTLNDKSESVRRMCKIILELDKEVWSPIKG